MKKQIALILAASPDDAPYIKYYTQIIKASNITYKYICWDRRNICIPDNNTYLYKQKRVSNNKLYRFVGFWGFRQYVNYILEVECFAGFILFGLQPAAFLSPKIFSKYRNKFIFDIRDFSKIYNIPIAKKIINNVLSKSSLSVISSLGFKRWLPANFEYVISHNIDVSLIFELNNYRRVYSSQTSSKIKILTIGQLRDFDINSRFMGVFANNCKYELEYAGDGIAYEPLLEYADKKLINNVSFTGRYNKDHELDIVEKCDYINIILPNDTLSKYLVSNRFYLSVLMKKPMIVNRDCHQADLVEKYNLGIVTTLDSIVEDIESYHNGCNKKNYVISCELFMSEVVNDYEYFKTKVMQFLDNL